MKPILLHPDDNVLVLAEPIQAGQTIQIDGAELVAPGDVAVGHKIARRALVAGEKILKYGAPIGSMTAAATAGEHVHMHNMKSDYIASHTRLATGEGQG
jgi:hypothetical protein